MKYYIWKFRPDDGFWFKRTKCNDYWSRKPDGCWQYTKEGAKKIVARYEERKTYRKRIYGIVAVDKVDEMLEQYEKQTDKETYMAEEMNLRPWWI